MTLLDQLLGDRAGTYLLISCLLVATLATIAAIIDIPLRALERAGFARGQTSSRLLNARLLRWAAIIAAMITFAAATFQAYLASSAGLGDSAAVPLFIATNAGLSITVVIWGCSGPLSRHWDLSLAVFGLGLATAFSLFGVVLALGFGEFGLLANTGNRFIFALSVSGILCSVGACIAAILAMLTYVLRGALQLTTQHRLHARDAKVHVVWRTPGSRRNVLGAIRDHQSLGSIEANATSTRSSPAPESPPSRETD